MCDETTEAENQTHLQGHMTRREMNLGAGATLAAMFTGCQDPGSASRSALGGSAPHATPPSPSAQPNVAGTQSSPADVAGAPARAAGAPARATVQKMVTVPTPDGAAEAIFVVPDKSRCPGVLMWPDVAGLRPAFKSMATRLAAQGYAVLCVNPYYRSSKLPVMDSFAEWQTEAGKAKVAPMRAALTAEAVTRDGAAFVAWLDEQPEVDTARKLASAGYCMSGSFTLRTAAAQPDRVGAVASFHGGGLVSADAASPHLLFDRIQVAALICIAQNDDARSPEDKVVLQKAANQGHVPAEVEVYPAQHGWCVKDSPVYDEAQAERAWSRLLVALGQL